MNVREAKRRAIERAQGLVAREPLFLDTETTGLHKTAEIIEVGVVDNAGRVVFASLVRPRRPIPADASAIHGITNEMVADAPTWQELWPELGALLQDRHVGIYNADYDLRLMRQSHRQWRLPWQPVDASAFCIMKLYAQFYGEPNRRYGGFRWQSLERAGLQCRLTLPNTHRAVDDARLARAVLHYIAQEDPP